MSAGPSVTRVRAAAAAMAAPLALVAALSLVGHGWRAARATEVASAQMGPSRDWRLFGVELSVLEGGEPAGRLREAAAARLALPEEELEAVTLVRRSLDARQQRTSGRRGRPTGKHEAVWSHVLDVRVSATAAKRIKAKSGRCVPAAGERVATEGQPQVWVSKGTSSGPALLGPLHVVVIGAGPCGLFAALQLARAGVNVTLCERGKPVEQRGRSIGALIRRGLIDPESNFCYGEGGAGTWSDGKLTTRIGRNSEEVKIMRGLKGLWARALGRSASRGCTGRSAPHGTTFGRWNSLPFRPSAEVQHLLRAPSPVARRCGKFLRLSYTLARHPAF